MKKFLRLSRKMLAALLAMLLLVTVVNADPAGQPDEIATSYYQVDGNKIRGIAPGTTGAKLRKVCVPGNLSVTEGPLATGDQLTCQSGGQNLTVIVTADINGDAKVSITDLLMLKSYLLGGELNPNATAAADVNYDGQVTITDFLRIKANLLGMEQIAPGRTAAAEDPLVLLMPGKTDTWTAEGAATYQSTDGSLVTVDKNGRITALNGEGSAIVYALDAQGVVLDRAIVTVLSESLTVSLGQETMVLTMGSDTKLKPRLNHPVQAAVIWSSSAPEVATVDNDGTVTSVKPGVTTITAQLSNGNCAQIKVTVASPITAVQTERKLYKIKPEHSRKLQLVQTPAEAQEVYSWESSDPAIARVSADGTVTGVTYGTVTITVTGKYSGLSASCDVKICDVKQVALTFDDGPSGQTPRLLDYLKENDIRVTFFLVGNRMPEFSESVKRQVAEGHEMGYHSYAHRMQTGLSDAQIKSDFDKANKMLQEMTGAEFTVWRTPGGNYNDRVLKALPLPHIMWSVDTLDWKNRNASSVYYSVVNSSRDGSIVLMHDLYGSTVDGAIMAMNEMQKGDYEFVTVTELLSRDGTPPEPSVSYSRAP